MKEWKGDPVTATATTTSCDLAYAQIKDFISSHQITNGLAEIAWTSNAMEYFIRAQ